MHIWLLDESLRVTVYYDGTDREFSDNICICFRESCPQDEKIFKADETNIYLTERQDAVYEERLAASLQRLAGFFGLIIGQPG